MKTVSRHVCGVMAASLIIVAIAPPASAGPTFAVKVFADVPAPGHPAGVVVHGGRVIVSTTAGSFYHPNTQSERVFTYDRRGRLLRTTFVDEGPVSTMGLAGMAFDGLDRLYVVDMNNSITRYEPDGSSRLWTSAPFPYAAGSYWTCMWTDVDFDARGNAYIPDGIGSSMARIWRITPDGGLSIWFEQPLPLNGGPYQAQIDARGKYLYFTRVIEGDRLAAGLVYRLPLKDHPQAGDLEEIHRFPADSSDVTRTLTRTQWFPGPQTNGLAIGASGRLYVAVSNRNEIAVLDPHGKLIRTIPSHLFNYPSGLAFLGDKLLVANTDYHETEHSDAWKILSVDVGDSAVSPFTPRNTR